MTASLVTLLAVALTAADAPKDAEALQGTWKVVTAEKSGKTQDDATEFVMVFEKDTFTVKRGGDAIIKGTFKLDPSKSPKTIDMTITEARKEQDKDKEVVGIYQLDKDTLKWCATDPGEKDRPTEFATKEGNRHMFVTFKKEKP
jgi:uncharacterized protein (TIGR03067 family)